MKTCPDCGKKMPDGAQFCGNCGAVLTSVPSDPVPPQNQNQGWNGAGGANQGYAWNGAQSQNQGWNGNGAQSQNQGWNGNGAQSQNQGWNGAGAQNPNQGWNGAGAQSQNQGWNGAGAQNPNQAWNGAAARNMGGMPVSAQGAGNPSGGGKKLLIGIGALVVVALLVVVVVKLIVPLFSSPSGKFIAYQEELLLDDMLDKMQEKLDSFGSGEFSSDITVTGSVDDSQINTYLEDSSVCLKLDMDRDSLLANGEVTLMGSPILSAAATYEKGRLGVYLPEVDDTYYVMDLSEMIYSLTGEEIELGAFSVPELSGEEWVSLIRAYLDIVYTAVNDDNVEVERGESIRLEELGGRVDGTVYTFEPRAEDVEEMLLALSEHIREDEALRSAIMKAVNPDMLAEVFGEQILGGYDLEEELDDGLMELADALEEEAAEIGEEVEDSGFRWTLGVEGKEVRLIRLETRVSDFAIVYERNGSEKEMEEALYTVSSYDGDIFMMRNSYEKDGSEYIGEALFSDGYGGEITLEYTADEEKKTYFGIPYGEYAISSKNMGVSAELIIEESGKGVDHTFRVEGMSYYMGSSIDWVEVTVNTTEKSTAEAPKAREEDISDYSEEELYQLLMGIGETLGTELYDNMAPFIYG